MKELNQDFNLLASKYALIDLHLHLDGSLTPEGVVRMAEMDRVSLSTYQLDEIEKQLVCPDNCQDLEDYRKCFDLPIAVMQHTDNIRFSVYDLVKRLNEQGILYAEIRYAPQQHTQKGLTQNEVVVASIEGLNKALAECDIKANLILCCMRADNNEAANLETVRLTKEYLGSGVVACDLAGSEALFETRTFEKVFDYAQRLGVPYTIHAGEADGMSSMKSAIEFGVKRMGHGIRSYNNDEMKDVLSDNNIYLELCPKSNLNTKAVDEIKSIADYPIDSFFSSDVLVTVNTDNLTVSNTTLQNEYATLFAAGALTEAQARMSVINAVYAAFLSDAAKEEVMRKCLE